MDVVELLPELHLLRFPVGQAYLWRDPDALTLIDAGLPGSADDIARAIGDLGYRTGDLRQVVLTHFHVDHIGSAGEIGAWDGVTLLAHRLDAPFIRGDASGPPPILTDEERPLYERIMPSVPPVTPTSRVDRQVEDGDVLDLAGGARVVHIPGHTPGSIALHLPGPRVLFTGDTVAGSDGRPMLGVFNVDRAGTISSFRRLAELDVEVACFGHGDPILGRASRALRAAAGELDRVIEGPDPRLGR